MQAIRGGGRLLAVLLFAALLVCGGLGTASAAQVGEKAPDFTLPGTTADEIKLSDYIGQKHLVMFFYVGAFTGL